jgi:hypothetical protein
MSILERTVDRRNDYVGAPVKRVSWASIFSGVVVGLAVSVALTMLGITVGLVGPERSAEIGVASGTTWAIVTVLSLFIGGWTAGRLCGLRRSFEGAMHGFITWAVMSVALLIFAGSFSLAFYGMSSQPAPGGLMGIEEVRQSTQGGQMTPPETPANMRAQQEIERDCHTLIEGTTLSPEEKTALKEQLRPEIAALVAGLERGDHDEARTRLIDSLLDETELGRAAIAAEVDRWIDVAKASEVRSERRRKGPKHKRERRHRPGAQISANSRAIAGWSFLFIFLGAAGAMFGGWVGSGSMKRAASEIMPAPRQQPTQQPTTQPPRFDSADDD